METQGLGARAHISTVPACHGQRLGPGNKPQEDPCDQVPRSMLLVAIKRRSSLAEVVLARSSAASNDLRLPSAIHTRRTRSTASRF